MGVGMAAGFRLVRALSPGDVGSRVVVRRTLPGGGAGDVLGELVSYDDQRLAVRTRDGAVVEVAQADVLAGKPVPPPPAPRRGRGGAGTAPAVTSAEIAEVERANADGWAPFETAELGGWLLRAGGGFTGRANSVLPLGDPGLPLDEALERVAQWYAERGIRPRFQLPLPLAADLADALEARGWRRVDDSLVLTAPLDTVLARTADLVAAAAGRGAPAPPPVDLADTPSEAWLSLYHYRGGDLPPVARQLLVTARTRAFATASEDGAAVAVGRVAVSGRWAGVTAMEVAPHARRRGLAAHVLGALGGWAGERGADAVYLQTMATNEPALALYRRLGFTMHHPYHYRWAPERP
ncbi:MAG: GNAT family N-acetyltransferase [Actinomycetota bacterium]|nr:GNAT family N-acetyltransferase [Actinomycetota bacterium]